MKVFSKFLLSFVAIAVCFTAEAQYSGWEHFESATFKDEYVEEFYSYASLLELDDYILGFEGKEFTISGHYIPVMDEEVIIISKYPYANCFFCGGAGLESIIEIRPKDKLDKEFILDEKLTFKGELKLNGTDWQLVSFILEDAVLVKK